MKRIDTSDAIRWALQILLWGGLWLLFPLLMEGLPENPAPRNRLFLLAGLNAALVAVNVALLFPGLYHRRRYLLYFLAGLGMAIVWVFLQDWIQDVWATVFRGERPAGRGPGPGVGRPRQDPGFYRYLFRSFPMLLSFLGSAAIEITVYSQRQAKAAIQMQKEKLESEVKWLRWQMNPHFLFNALNNIYSLTVIKSDHAPEHLLSLSDMMRYMLYEGNKDRVPLRKELEYLQKYIQLQQLKDSRGLNVTVTLSEPEGHLQIVPQLLLPFVENAFKHSNIEDLNNGWIRINLEDLGGGKIRFVVENSVPGQNFDKDQQGGLGLANVRRLLDLMYPGKHLLEVNQSSQQFSICLELALT